MRNREEIFKFLENYSQNTKEQIDTKKTKNSLLKSYVFESFNKDFAFKNVPELTIHDLYNSKDLNIKQIDEQLYSVYLESKLIGYLESINDRFQVLYSFIGANISDAISKKILKSSGYLDSMWISGKYYEHLLKQMVEINHPYRYTKIKFEYTSLYEKLKYTEDEISENSNSSISVVEPLDGIEQKIKEVKKYLPSFNNITSLRIPASEEIGGHDIYYNGKITNRSNSFYNHRNLIIENINTYKNITEDIENIAWLGLEKIPSKVESSIFSFKAAPITIGFSKSIPLSVLNNFVHTAFSKGKEPFKILGDIFQVSEKQYHIYGTDLHLWQNVFLDISDTHFTIYLPVGTCGNTIHRLITNIQRYLSPQLDVYIGEHNLDDMINNEIWRGSNE